MAIIKCKMCGGDIEISADKTFGTCEYCGSTMTLPKTDDDQRLSLFNRGTHLRRNGEFDKAAAIYERLIGENDADAEAHWNLLLCRYGIEYVQDPASGERIPTCHRASFDSILNDVDYQAALQYSDGVARSLYEKEAQRIAALQRDILAISQKESPFDVFICYKESDENGRRTKDSALAQDIYYQLTDAGYKVFFARITLEDKLGQEYEPYIFAALHSAKVMVVVGTKPEYLNAVWVKNEWSRYLALMRTDRSRLLIPCYRDMDPYDMPEELSMLQSQDMGRIGFIQDLIRGVRKVVDAAKPQPEQPSAAADAGTKTAPLLRRGTLFLEDGDWANANQYFEKVLDAAPECAEAYLGKFLAQNHAKSAADYANARLADIVRHAPSIKNTDACAADGAFISACTEKYQVDGYLSSQEITRMLSAFDRQYCSQAAYYRTAAETARSELDTDRNLTRARQFGSDKTRAQCQSICDSLFGPLAEKLRQCEEEDARQARSIREDYAAFLKKAEEKVTARSEQLRQKEAQAQLEQERQQREAEEAERQRRLEELHQLAKARRKQTAKKIARGAVVAGLLLAAALSFLKFANRKYDQAVALAAEGSYAQAAEAFDELKTYRDSKEQFAENMRLAGEAYLASGETARAAMCYAKIGDPESMEKSYALWDTVAVRKTISVGYNYTAALKDDGTVVFTDRHAFDSSPAGWHDIIAIACGDDHLLGLRADGSVCAAGRNTKGECDVSDWKNIVAIAAGMDYSVGLRADGTVVTAGRKDNGNHKTGDWTDIVAIDAKSLQAVALKADGTVIMTGDTDSEKTLVESWTDIKAISAGWFHTVGIKQDGTVVAAGHDTDGACDVGSWSNICAAVGGGSTKFDYTIGLRTDGTLVVTRPESVEAGSARDIAGWSSIVAVATGTDTEKLTLGLRSDGTVVAVGDTDGIDLSEWTNIKLPNR